MKIKAAHFIAVSIVFILLATAVISCSSDSITNPPNPNEAELITTLIVNLTDSVTGASSSFEFDDPDGEGGNAPITIDTIRMDNGRVYFCDIVLLNKSVTPADTISNEVEEEGDEHQFFFTVLGLNTIIEYDDADVNGNPIGLKTIWRSGTTAAGAINIVLKHQPGTKAPAPGDPNVGETDVAVDFITIVN